MARKTDRVEKLTEIIHPIWENYIGEIALFKGSKPDPEPGVIESVGRHNRTVKVDGQWYWSKDLTLIDVEQKKPQKS